MTPDEPEAEWPDKCGQCKNNPHSFNGGFGVKCHTCKKFLCHTCCEEGYDGDEDIFCEACWERGCKPPPPTAAELEAEGQLDIFNPTPAKE